jgi:hypothetical protein
VVFTLLAFWPRVETERHPESSPEPHQEMFASENFYLLEREKEREVVVIRTKERKREREYNINNKKSLFL